MYIIDIEQCIKAFIYLRVWLPLLLLLLLLLFGVLLFFIVVVASLSP